jgi:hypothetical protein
MMDVDFLFDSMPSCCFYHILVHCSARDLPLSWSHLKNTPFDLLFLSRSQSSEKRGGMERTESRSPRQERGKETNYEQKRRRRETISPKIISPILPDEDCPVIGR